MAFYRRRIVHAATWILLAVVGVASAGEDVRPYDLGVRVVYGEARGPESLREQLERALYEEMRDRRCYRQLKIVTSDVRESDDLILKVRVDEVYEQVEHDLSIAERAKVRLMEQKLMYRVSFRLQAEVGLLASGIDAAVAHKPYRYQTTLRPRTPSDDPKARIRIALLDDFSRRVAALACKPSASKLERTIEQARESASPPR